MMKFFKKSFISIRMWKRIKEKKKKIYILYIYIYIYILIFLFLSFRGHRKFFFDIIYQTLPMRTAMYKSEPIEIVMRI